MPTPFEDLFESTDLEARLEDALRQAREANARLEVEIRVQPPGGNSRREHVIKADANEAPRRIMGKLKTACESSPGAPFEGQIRFNMRQAGDAHTVWASFSRNVGPSDGGPGGTTNEERLYQMLMETTRQSHASVHRMSEGGALLVENTAKLVAALTPPPPPEPKGFLGQLAAPLVTMLMRPQLQAAHHAPQPVVAHPPPGFPQAPVLGQAPAQIGAPAATQPAAVPPGQSGPVSEEEKAFIRAWLIAHPQEGVAVAFEALSQIPPEQQATLMQGVGLGG